MLELEKEWSKCTKCRGIGANARNHVFYDRLSFSFDESFEIDTFKKRTRKISAETRKLFYTNLMYKPVDILFIGEGPGLIEDVKGLPFVGSSGQLLRQSLLDANVKCPECDDDGLTNDCSTCQGEGIIKIGFINLLMCRPYEKNPKGTGNRPPTQREVINCFPRLITQIKLLNPAMIIALGQEASKIIPLLSDLLNADGYQIMTSTCVHPSAILRRDSQKEDIDYYTAHFKKLYNIFWTMRKKGYYNGDS